MRIINKLDDCCKIHNAVVTIGTFDGVHLGHQHILNRVVSKAREIKGESLIITFWPHPRHVVKDNRPKLKLLNTLEEKFLLFEKSGIDNVLIIPFTKQFANQSPEVFINELVVKKIKAKHIVIGYDHRFGKDRSGSFSFLQQKSRQFGLDVEEIEAFKINGQAISSTLIRKLLVDGAIEQVKPFLGYGYFLQGKVIKGLGLGRKMGYPTANIDVDTDLKLLPKKGIYVCRLKVEDTSYFGMMNIGMNPTIEGKGWSLEVHAFGLKDKIYDKSVNLMFLKRLRDEKKFASIALLKEQMDLDKVESLKYIESIKDESIDW